MIDQATILAVDDTAESLALLVRILTQAGYQVRPADSGELALAAAAANPPDLILLDIHMKGLDGLDVCRLLKAAEKTQHIPIILISSFSEVKDWVAGLQLGAADYITKPFQSEELLMRVSTHLSLSQANASLSQHALALQQVNEQLRTEIVERQQVEDKLRQSLQRVERSHQAILGTLEDRRKAQEALKESNDKLEQLFELLPVGITVLDRERKILKTNPALEKILGLRTEETRTGDNPKQNYFRPDGSLMPVEEFASSRIMNGETQVFHVEMGVEQEDSTMVWTDVSAVASPFSDWNIIIVTMDITALKRAEAEQRKITDRLALACHAGGIGIWALDVIHNNLIWDDQMYHLYESWRAGVHPDDLQKSEADLQMALRGEKDFDTEFRVVWPDETIHTIRAHANVQRDASGQAINLTGTNYDITARKLIEVQLTEQLYELRRWYTATLGREERVLELKLEINQLLAQTGQPPRYPSAEPENQ
jgi:PAS domain S-box-containing protein